ncbi:hypothetical protein V6Z11_A08G038900 [Gossypium hirsutum]
MKKKKREGREKGERREGNPARGRSPDGHRRFAGAGAGHRVRLPEKGMEELVVEEEHAAADGVRLVGVWGCYSGAVYGAKYKWGRLRLSRLRFLKP